MHAGSTLFLDVSTQHDLWPGGPWPLVSREEAQSIARLFALARVAGVRQGGIVCRHAPAGAGGAAGRPTHCERGTSGAARVAGCEPRAPVRVWTGDESAEDLDRGTASYLATGCGRPVDASTVSQRVFDHLTAGVRDAVVFGAGLEYGVARAVDALRRRRIRTHVILDATGAADPAEAQQLIAAWKRGTVDVLTTASVERLLRAA